MDRVKQLDRVYRNDRVMAKLTMTDGVNYDTRVYALRQFIIRSSRRAKELADLGSQASKEHMFQRALQRTLNHVLGR